VTSRDDPTNGRKIAANGDDEEGLELLAQPGMIVRRPGAGSRWEKPGAALEATQARYAGAWLCARHLPPTSKQTAVRNNETISQWDVRGMSVTALPCKAAPTSLKHRFPNEAM